MNTALVNLAIITREVTDDKVFETIKAIMTCDEGTYSHAQVQELAREMKRLGELTSTLRPEVMKKFQEWYVTTEEKDCPICSWFDVAKKRSFFEKIIL